MDKSIVFIYLFISRQAWCIQSAGIIGLEAIMPGLCSAEGVGIQGLAQGKHSTNWVIDSAGTNKF